MSARQVSEHAAIGKLIRAELKRLGFAGTVHSKINCVRIEVTDLNPTQRDALQAFCRPYKYGGDYKNIRHDVPQVEYIFIENCMSDEMKSNLRSFVQQYYASDFESEEFALFQYMHQFFSGVRPSFWASGSQPEEVQS